MRLPVLSTAAFTAALIVGCAPALPPPVAPVAAADVTAVPAPSNLLVFGRFSRPVASSKVATDWAHLPELDGTDFVDGLLEGVTDSKRSRKLGSIVDPSQSIDYALTLEPRIGAEPGFAIAFGMKSLDAAKRALASTYELTAGDNGVLRLEATGGHSSEALKGDDDASKPCELAPSAGASPYRLICASTNEALTELGPYLARTTPRETIAADAHLEIHAQPIKGLASLGRMQGPAILAAVLGLSRATDPATIELVDAVVGDLLDYTADLDAMTLDATLEPAQGTIAFHTTFKSATSFTARMTAAHPERADVPPSAFLRLPADVDLAWFTAGIDDADLQHPRDLLVAAAREQLKKTKLAVADQSALTDLLQEGIRGSRVTFAHGATPEPYWLFESDTPGAHSAKVVRDAVAAFTRPGVAKWVGSRLPGSVTLPTWKVASPLAGLPKGSLHIEVTEAVRPAKPLPSANGKHAAAIPARARAASIVAAPPEVIHLVVVADGPRSWFAMSPSVAVIRAKLAAVLGSTAPTPSPAVQALKDMRMTSGGFMTVRSVVELAREATKRHHVGHVHWDEILHHLPANGTTPILMTAAPGTPTSEDPGGTYEMNVTVPADAVRDAVWLGVQLEMP
jgi:hypothetical protein